MAPKRALFTWILAAASASLLLAGVLLWDYSTRAHWGIFLLGDPRVGEEIFDRKGCTRCHAINGYGGKIASDLGIQLSPQKGLNEFVAAMWNHAPVMWERMQTEKFPYPPFDYREMAHLFAFLYIVRYVDEPGDPSRGKDLVRSKGCIQCHPVRGNGGVIGPDLAEVARANTSLLWIQTMWNHAPAMGSSARMLGLSWPEFEHREMNDLIAYIQGVNSSPRAERHFLPANPRRGWELFQSKSCIVCHSVREVGGNVGPPLDRGELAHLTLGELAVLMWNRSPRMWGQMKSRGIAPPTFQGQELADLVAFLQGVSYSEPGGSVADGEKVFSKSGCSQCHGSHAEGTRQAPGLRRGAETFSGVTLAMALWSHGPKMYHRVREQGLPWPTLAAGDLGPLLGYLNASPDGK